MLLYAAQHSRSSTYMYCVPVSILYEGQTWFNPLIEHEQNNHSTAFILNKVFLCCFCVRFNGYCYFICCCSACNGCCIYSIKQLYIFYHSPISILRTAGVVEILCTPTTKCYDTIRFLLRSAFEPFWWAKLQTLFVSF